MVGILTIEAEEVGRRLTVSDISDHVWGYLRLSDMGCECGFGAYVLGRQ
jgi:hypothetical protein